MRYENLHTAGRWSGAPAARAVALLVVALTAAGCGPAGSASGSGSGTRTPAAVKMSGGGSAPSGAPDGSCGAYTAGKDGVVRTFCDGPATATFTVGGRTYRLKGGTCEASAGLWSVNIGVVIGPGFTGRTPDYLGLNVPLRGGTFSGADADANVGGKGYPLKASGVLAADRGSGTFTGKEILGSATVNGTFTC
jgi:hypothetical protein